MSYIDKDIECSECGVTFTYTAYEQKNLASNGYTDEPRQCLLCRLARRAVKSNCYSLNNNRPGRGTFHVVCSRCGRETEVPFQPRNGMQFYCRDY